MKHCLVEIQASYFVKQMCTGEKALTKKGQILIATKNMITDPPPTCEM